MIVTVNVKKVTQKITKEDEKKNKKSLVQSTILDWRIQPGSCDINLVCLPGVEVAEPRLEDKVDELKEKTKVFEVNQDTEVVEEVTHSAAPQQQQLSGGSPPKPGCETKHKVVEANASDGIATEGGEGKEVFGEGSTGRASVVLTLELGSGEEILRW